MGDSKNFSKRGQTIITEFLDTVWYMYPDNFRMLMDMVTNRVSLSEELALTKRTQIQKSQESRMKMIGDTGIAYIPVMGTIHPRASFYTEVCGGTSISSLTAEFLSARDNPDIKGIIFDHDSPGGIATGINAFSQMVFESRGTKPIYSFVDGTCASAAFWIASAADKVVVDPTARLGSVGTVVGVPKKGIDSQYVEITNSGSPFKRPDVENEEHYKTIVKYLDDMTDVFYESLARNFDVTSAHVKEHFGKGGLKIGEHAVTARMAHRTGSFDSVIDEILAEVDSGKFYQVTQNLSEVTNNSGGKMDIKELRANHPDLVAMVEQDAVASVKSENAALVSTIETLKAENASLSSAVIAKETTISTNKASQIFSTAFSVTSIPEKFRGRVEKDADAKSFIDEKGCLNESAFTDSVKASISSWEADFSGIVTQKPEDNREEATEQKKEKNVQGVGTEEEENSEDTSFIDRIVGMATK